MKRFMLTFVLAIAAGVWSLNWASGSQITSLCDEWNVLIEKILDFSMPYNKWYQYTNRCYLDADTVINSVRYTKAFYEDEYIGALRESEDASKVFGIPANNTHEYLFYDWSAQKGDTLQNYWVGYPMEDDKITRAIVDSISNTSPREFILKYCVSNKDTSNNSDKFNKMLDVIEGVGHIFWGPINRPRTTHDQSYLLCAYKNGEQVYMSPRRRDCNIDTKLFTEQLKGAWIVYKETLSTTRIYTTDDVTRYMDEEYLYFFTDSTMHIVFPTCYSTPNAYGICHFDNYTRLYVENLFVSEQFDRRFGDIKPPYSEIFIYKITNNEIEWSYTETYTRIEHHQYLRRYMDEFYGIIPLFVKDGPGSSTVEPVDPNLIYAILSKDILSIYAMKEMEINMVLYKAPSANHAPAVKRAIKATTFTDSISTTLTESGTYTLELTHPAWDYTIVGTFDYQLPQAVENTPANTPSATKILKDGQLILRYKGQMYNVQGQQVQ